MASVKGPNGLVLTLPDDIADGLLKSDDYELVQDEKKPATKSTVKPSSKK